jgi:aromatic-L-amino-acid/L-tryptophan decarboxylase
MAQALDRYRFAAPIALEQLVEDVSGMLERWSLHAIHPRYFGLFVPSVHPASVAADALVAGYNPQLAAWSHSPIANEIERHTLAYLSRCLGVSAAGAHFTSGGSEANHTAVLAALASTFLDYTERGVRGLNAMPTMYASEECHHSLVKIARHVGLGAASLRMIAVDTSYRMKVADLARAIDEDHSAGHRPFMAVATLGTTGAGAIDRVDEIADVCRDHGIWLHVDGAWGASACLSPALRRFVAGVERADSVTWDAHKLLYTSMGAGMFFTRHPDALRKAFTVATSYVPLESHEDPYQTSMQWSRRFIGLKVFMTLASLGAERIAADLERQVELGNELRHMLVDEGWLIMNDSALPVVCFAHPALLQRGGDHEALAARVRTQGNVWVSTVVLGGQCVLRACITSFRTTRKDVQHLMKSLRSCCSQDP